MLQKSLLVLTALLMSASLSAQERVVIRGGTLVDVRDGSLKPNTTVVIEGDKITSVSSGTAQVPPGGTVIDATGKYILPGLIDLHLHYKEWSPELYLNHGVTTTIDLGADHEWMKAQREGVRNGTIPGVRLFIGTNNLDGPPADPNNYFLRPYVELLKDPETAMMSMRRYVTEKVDAVKVYDGLSEQTLRAIGREAKRANLPVIGHFKDVHIAIDTGGNGLEHMVPIATELLDKQARAEAVKKVRKGFNPPDSAFMDFSRAPAVVQLMLKNGLMLNPTLLMSYLGDEELRDRHFNFRDFDLMYNDWRLRYVPIQWKLADLKEFQEVELWNWRDLSKYEREVFHKGFQNDLRFIKMFVDAGGKLYAGTDCANMCVPGLGTHEEMELMTASGIAPLKALQAATINPAELMRMQNLLGTVEPGKAGDVVVVDANPLEDIRNAAKIYKVISKGRVADGQYHADFTNPIPKNSFEDSSHFFPSPRIRSGAPEAFVESGSGASLTLEGTGFVPYSSVQWNGKNLKTQFVNEFELKAEVPADLLKIGTYVVTVANPDFATGTIFARGASDLAHLGVRSPVSNQFLVLVKGKGGAPIFPHYKEGGSKRPAPGAGEDQGPD